MDIEAIADRAAERAVSRTFLALGVDLNVPGEAVKVQQDFAFLRSTRTNWRSARTVTRNAIITAFVTSLIGGFATLAWHMVTAAKATGAH